MAVEKADSKVTMDAMTDEQLPKETEETRVDIMTLFFNYFDAVVVRSQWRYIERQTVFLMCQHHKTIVFVEEMEGIELN